MDDLSGHTGDWRSGPCRTCHYVCYPDGKPYCFRTDRWCNLPGCGFHKPPEDRNEDAIKILVAGPLTFTDQDAFDLVMDKAWRNRAIEAVVHWGGPGVPTLATRWCRKSSTAEIIVEPDGKRDSHEAELRYLLKKTSPRAIIAFPGKSLKVETLLTMVGVNMPVWRPFRG